MSLPKPLHFITPTFLLHANFLSLLTLTLTLTLHFLPSTSTLLDPHLPTFLSHHKVSLLATLWCALTALLAYLSTRPRPVLLLDYVCFKPDNDRKMSYEASEYFVRRSRRFNPTSEEFMRGIFLNSGLGDETYAPPFVFCKDYEERFQSAIDEADEGLFSAVEDLLAKTNIDPSLIDTLIVACGMFSPVPSLSSRLVNRFGFRQSIKTFNLTSMGCSVGATGCEMAAKILSRSRSIGYVLLAVTENISLNWYVGDNRSMLVSNCIFRLGSAAALITNDPLRRRSAKFVLTQSLTTNHAADDASYGVVFQEEDTDGHLGVTLKKDLMKIAGARLNDHIRILGPHVLPLTELLLYTYHAVRSSLLSWRRKGHEKPPRRAYVPDFTAAFEHLCVHAGGRAVVEAVEEVMGLKEDVLEPARMTLHRFGNSSGPLLFYELAYFEAKRRIREGDRLWMVSFGAGFMVCSLVWRALRDSNDEDPFNPWNDCVQVYPVDTKSNRRVKL